MFNPTLLRRSEFSAQPAEFSFIDITGESKIWKLPANSLAFTCCQVPVCYGVADAFSIMVETQDGGTHMIAGSRLGVAVSHAIFSRSGEVVGLRVQIPAGALR